MLQTMPIRLAPNGSGSELKSANAQEVSSAKAERPECHGSHKGESRFQLGKNRIGTLQTIQDKYKQYNPGSSSEGLYLISTEAGTGSTCIRDCLGLTSSVV